VSQALIGLNGLGGDALLFAYVVGGITLAAVSLLRGNKVGWRIFSIVAGLGMAAWAAYVLLFGGWIIISLKILILPVVLIVRSIITAVKRSNGANKAAAAWAPQPYGVQVPPDYPGAQPYAVPVPQGCGAPAPQGFSAPAPQGFSAPAPQGFSAPAPQPFGLPAPARHRAAEPVS
jgi:hypothetical protein